VVPAPLSPASVLPPSVVPSSSDVPPRRPHTWIAVHNDDGRLLGWMCKRETPRTKSIDAHCWCHPNAKPECKTDKSAKPGRPGTAQGRPLGFLFAWLLLGCCADCSDRELHCGAKKAGGEFACFLDYDTRLEAREWASSKPVFSDLFGFEREQWPDEGIEPKGLP
jgi:hypothetical protein